MNYETQLAKLAATFGFRYFQYLALLYTEIFLDCLTNDLVFLWQSSMFLDDLRHQEPELAEFPYFEPDNLRHFFMAPVAENAAHAR